MDKIAALKARVAAAVGSSKGGGLAVGLHPALEDLGSVKPASEQRRPTETRSNPYLDSTPLDQQQQGPAPKPRPARPLEFNPKGKYIQQGNALRRQAALEAMKARIAAQTRKAGIDEIPSEKNFVVEAPPEVEWFDESYFPEGKAYKDFDDSSFPDLVVQVSGSDGLITDLVQHPIPIEPPQDKLVPDQKPLYMTRKEQKKLRRQRRMAAMKESQAKQRLGLEPTPGPKVKPKNLIRILGDEAIQDPTAVEARVNREVAERHQTHLQANEDRKLSKEQRHEKIQANQEKDAAKGLRMVVFRVDNLTDGKHRFKIAKNAEQLALTGICLLHPKMNMVIVEGGEWGTNKYKKLMLNRIEWTIGVPTTKDQESDPDWMKGNPDLSTNRCQLIFEGEVKERAFRKWSSKICETDREAVELLARNKLDSFWLQAINNN